MIWANKQNGKRVIFLNSIEVGGIPRAVISDSGTMPRKIEVDLDWFYDNYTPVTNPDEPHVGEIWTMTSSFRQVAIKSASEGYIVAQVTEDGYMPFVQPLAQFLDKAQRGVIKRPMPNTDHTGYEAMNFPIMMVDDVPTIDFGLARWEYFLKDSPWSGGQGREHGIVRVPLAWDRAEVVSHPDA